MVFMVEPQSISAAVTRLPHSVGTGDPTLGAYCRYVAYFTCWYHLYRFTMRKVHPSSTESADFMGGNGKNDTNDTKPWSRDTPTIQGITTMKFAGVLDADFVAKTVS
jgi:hypothetical protein